MQEAFLDCDRKGAARRVRVSITGAVGVSRSDRKKTRINLFTRSIKKADP